MKIPFVHSSSKGQFLSLLAVGSSLALGLVTPLQATTLYGITGDGGSPRETLFTIDTTTAAATLFLTLGAGGDGEAIGFNPVDGRMYHASGISTGSRFWESIDLGVPSVATSTPLATASENLALTWNPATGTFLASHLNNNYFYSITAAGVATDIGSTPENLKGLAFVGSTLYGASAFSSKLYDLNPLDGAANSDVSVTMAGFSVVGMNGLATNPDSGVLYGIVRTLSGRHLATIDPTTGVATNIGLISGGSGWAGLAFGAATAVPDSAHSLLLVSLALFSLAAIRRGVGRKEQVPEVF